MDRSQSVVTPERFAKGMTFEQYLRFIATPENPLENIRTLRQVKFVMKDGKVVKRE